MNKLAIAVVGAGGYVGEALCLALERNSAHKISRVLRSNYSEMMGNSYDILINSAMPSKRFWAKKYPEEDFRETVQKTADLLRDWKFKKFIQISTLSARCEPHTIYGQHKAAAEKLCASGDNLIVRLTAMYSKNLAKGALMDILHQNKVFVSQESRYAFASLDFVSAWIASHLDRKGLVEVGAKNSLSLGDIAEHLGVAIEFEGPVDIQEIQYPEPDFPDAKDVYFFLDTMKKQTKVNE